MIRKQTSSQVDAFISYFSIFPVERWNDEKSIKRKKKLMSQIKKMSLWLSPTSAEMKSWDWQATAERSLAPLGWQRLSVYEKVGGNWPTVQRQGLTLPEAVDEESWRPSLPRGNWPSFLVWLCTAPHHGAGDPENYYKPGYGRRLQGGGESIHKAFQPGKREQTNKTESLLYKVSVNHSVVSGLLCDPLDGSLVRFVCP